MASNFDRAVLSSIGCNSVLIIECMASGLAPASKGNSDENEYVVPDQTLPFRSGSRGTTAFAPQVQVIALVIVTNKRRGKISHESIPFIYEP